METKITHGRLRYLKAPARGEVVCRFATLGVKDLDQDVILPGAIGEQQVRVSAFGHASWGGALPVGTGRAFERGNEALAELAFFMNTAHGSDAFNTIKGLGSLGQWSMGFDVLEEGSPTKAERAQGVRRILKELRVHEVSPVFKGAGINTGTLSAKCGNCGAIPTARATTARLRAAGELLARAVPVPQLEGRTSGVVHRAEFTGRPTAEAKLAADFTVDAGQLLHGRNLLPERPAVRYFRPESLPWGATDRIGLANAEANYIGLRDDLETRQVVATTLHELRHLAQKGLPFTLAEAEDDASGFSSRWTPVILRAFRETKKGQLYRVAVVDVAKPSGRAPHLDLRICRPSTTLWQHDSWTTQSAWRQLTPDY